MTAVVLTAAPSLAQSAGRRSGGEGNRREGVGRAQPRGGGERAAPPRGGSERAAPHRQDNRADNHEANRSRERAAPPPPRQDNRTDNRDANRRSDDADRRANNNRDDRRANGNRDHDRTNWIPHDSYRNNRRADDNRSSGSWTYRPYGRRSYVLPYGYRPRGYRPGWNLNLYFGRPYAYHFPADGYVYDGYGYYAFAPGHVYGSLRIVDAPRDAQVFVDGYYAGVVDEYDGVFQHLNLEVGSHHIEIEALGYPPVAFDVYITPGHTITYRAPFR
jgi:hypothetical protein